MLLAQKDDFARAITGKLMTYALGRGLERCDRRDIEQDGREGGGARLPLLERRHADRAEPRFQLRRAETPAPAGETAETRTAHVGRSFGRAPIEPGARTMIITGKHLSRRTILRGARRDGRPARRSTR